jgi:hypothetical protein
LFFLNDVFGQLIRQNEPELALDASQALEMQANCYDGTPSTLPDSRKNPMTQAEAAESIVTLLAGTDNKGQAILEKLPVLAQSAQNVYQLLRSPLLVRGLAAGDIFHLADDQTGRYAVISRGGWLCVRVFSRDDIESLDLALTPAVEKYDGKLDLKTARALVYSIHVNNGFSAVETLFDNIMANFPGTVWYYGNVYDPVDGVTPLNWWDAFLNTV